MKFSSGAILINRLKKVFSLFLAFAFFLSIVSPGPAVYANNAPPISQQENAQLEMRAGTVQAPKPAASPKPIDTTMNTSPLSIVNLPPPGTSQTSTSNTTTSTPPPDTTAPKVFRDVTAVTATS